MYRIGDSGLHKGKGSMGFPTLQSVCAHLRSIPADREIAMDSAYTITDIVSIQTTEALPGLWGMSVCLCLANDLVNLEPSRC